MSIVTGKPEETGYKDQFLEFLRETWLGYALVLPATVLLGVIMVYPTLEAIWMSFYTKSFLNPEDAVWIGLQNYSQMYGDPLFWQSLRNSVILTSVAVSLEYLAGLGLALVLKQKVPGIKFFRSVTMVTWVLPIIVTVIIFNFLVQYPFGVVNVIFEQFGLPTTYWFGQPGTGFGLIIFMHVWRNAPFFAIALMASMQAIPESYYEAASIDGASTLQKFRYITLPHISYTSMIMIVIHVIFTFNNFDFVYLSTGGGPYQSTEVLPTYVYKEAFQSYALGYAASVGTVMLVIMFVFTVVYVKLETSE
ncbi:carbohydrate ABC transporter permease [Halopenitus salinus]|uniref:Carbohydrate ABC transporter permease n=1 Tax=Halopenitus salinus TaxID=1198295 RepID=A0ABD5UQ02_9EURY